MRVHGWFQRGSFERVRRSVWVNGIAVGAVVAPLALGGVAMPAPLAAPAAPVPYLGTPVVGLRPAAVGAAAAHATAPRFVPKAVTWPSVATAVAAIRSPGADTAARARAVTRSGSAGSPAAGERGYAAGTPVWAQALNDPSGSYRGPSSVSVRVLDHGAATAAGVTGVVFTATPTAAGRGTVRIGVDYGSFAQAYGGNYGSRLRLVQLPACALTTPQLATCRAQTPLNSANDAASSTVSAPIAFGSSSPAHFPAGNTPASPAAGAADAGSAVFALSAGPSAGDGGGLGGTFGATSLKPSGSWSAGGSSGSFTYSYPITVPPAASSLVPTVGLSYNSGSVDGQTATTQSQGDWAGDGWSTPENFIEQSFVSCADSPEGVAAPQATSDMCYDGPILNLSLNGSSTSLVCAANCNSAGAVWKPADDNGEVVTHQVNTGNGSGTYNTDYWTVTDRDGTVFSFGLNHLPGWSSQPGTGSVQSEPVYSGHNPNDPTKPANTYSDPCYNATWSLSWCTTAYRWNLDYVKDLHGNAMAYYYQQDTNAYAQNGNTASATGYTRDAHLDHIDYGFTDGNAYGTAPDRIQFTPGDRCFASSCDPIAANKANWPDVPYDLNCAAKAACQVTGPSFWSTVRLTTITTEQYNGTTYLPIDSYGLGETEFTQPTGDTTNPTLWLSQITRTGQDISAGGSAPPAQAVTFGQVPLPNRADTTNGFPSLNRNRITSVTTETGATISVGYERTNPCATPVTLNPATNTSSCFPVYWTPPSYHAQILDWFNKYAVSQVTVADLKATGNGIELTQYKYPAGPAWHYDDNELVQAKYRTYGQYRGYGDVQTLGGQGADAVTESETTYYRGMSDDDNTTAVTLGDSQGGAHDDTNQLAGQVLESTQYNYRGGPILGSSINSYWVSAPTLSRTRSPLPALTANAIGQVETWTRTALTDGGATTWRKTETDTAYDTSSTDHMLGLPTVVYQHGDLALTGDNQQRCSVTTYAPPNVSANLIGLTGEVETDALPCGGANPGGATAPTAAQTNAQTAPAVINRPTDVVSDTRTFYDLQPVDSTSEPSTTPAWPQTAPTYGDIAEGQVATGYAGGAFTYQVKTAATFDSYGRGVASWDGLGRKTQSNYTMTNGVTTAVAITNPLGQTVSTTLDPYRALPLTVTDPNGITTTAHYDGLGRTIAAWNYGRATTLPADNTYAYTLSTSAPSVVTTQSINDSQGYTTSTTLYDALGRVRQTQSPTPQGGRLINDVFYDTRGWAWKKNTGYWNSTTAPDSTLMTVGDSAQGNFDQDVLAYDGAGRAVQDQSYNQGVLTTTSYSAYYGDRTVAIPPVGTDGKITGTPTATVTDAIGRTTELDQYTTAPTVTSSTTSGITTVTLTGGTSQATDYVFNNTGQQTDIKDPQTGADWNTSYNLLGQAVTKNDPDGGATTGMVYDPVGNLLQSTDARGKTLSTTYDALNRKTGQYDAPTASQSSSNQLASWTYDNNNNVTGVTNPIGHLTTATAFVSGNAYTTQSKGFNAWGESRGETITLPGSEGALAGPYSFTHTYSPGVGLPYRDIYPASPGSGALPGETVTHGFAEVSGLDLPTGSAGLNSYQLNDTYDAYGRLAQAQLGSTIAYAYLDQAHDPHTGRLTDTQLINTAVSATPIDETAYKYDAVGDPTAQTETRQGATAETQCYRYDQLDRLTQAWTATDQCAATPAGSSHATVGDAIPNAAYWTSWQYNSDGTRKNETDHSLTGATDTSTDYTYGATATGCPSAGGIHTLQSATTDGTLTGAYCYDQAGNTTQRNTTATGQQSLTWNDQGQLAAVTTASAGSSYIYDADGSLLLQKDPGTTTLYLPGEQLVLNTATNAITGTRFYPLSGGAQAVRTGATTNYNFELSDQNNTSTLTLSNTLTGPVWRQQTPYGAPRGTAPTTWPDNHGFLNKPQDTTTGLTDVGARWYDPTTGTFASLDPLLEPTSPQQLNGYSYAAGNPVTNSDPSGLTICDITGDCGNTTGVNTPYMQQQDNTGGCDSACWGPTGVQCDSGCMASRDAAYAQQWAAQQAVARRAKIEQQIAQYRAELKALQQRYEQSLADDGSSGCSAVAILSCIGWHFFGTTAADYYKELISQGLQIAALDGVFKLGELLIGKGIPALLDAASASAKAGDIPTAIADDQKALDDAEAALKCAANSFVGTTPILMADGTSKPIDQVKIGDKIANNLPGADPGTKDQTHTITAIHITYTDHDYTDVTINTGHGPATIAGTAHHPYWDQTTHAWTDANQLHPGDQLQATDGHAATILALRDYTTTTVTYNLTIDTLHTYYVVAGSTPVLVHNVDEVGCGPVAGGGAKLSNLSVQDQGAIQNMANLLKKPITVVGSRAGGTFGPGSDYDYLVPNLTRDEAVMLRRRLPSTYMGIDESPGIDVMSGDLVPGSPYIRFDPQSS